jgi:DNA processing protein
MDRPPRDLSRSPHAPIDARDAAPEARRALRVWLALALAFPLRASAARSALHEANGDVAAASRRGARTSGEAELAAAADALARAGALLVPVTSAVYPARLAALPDAPPVLFVQGDASRLGAAAVAVVGARAPSPYGTAVARRLATGLADAGLCVVSGLARGIDGAAHRAALDAGGVTVAVQGCGPDLVYPPSHRGLAARIAERGALVTELPPGAPPLPHHFPLRNRLISGLARAVVVVEARERSGSLGTALHAADQGREVFAVPGPINAPTSAGANRLLRDGAHPFLELADVLQRLGVTLPGPAAAPAPDAAAALGADAKRLLASLARAPATRDELAARLGRAAPALESALLELELAGVVAEDRTGRLRALAPASRGAPR